jgi:hypothetical protein
LIVLEVFLSLKFVSFLRFSLFAAAFILLPIILYKSSKPLITSLKSLTALLYRRLSQLMVAAVMENDDHSTLMKNPTKRLITFQNRVSSNSRSLMPS